MSFRFEKLYADLVTPDGVVCIVYAATATWWRLRYSYAGVEVFWPDGRRVTSRIAGHVDERALPRPGRCGEIGFATGAGPMRLSFDAQLAPWKPAGSEAVPGLDWRVEMPRAKGTLVWPGAPDGGMSGLGYVDRLRLERRLRGRDMVSLEWGRAHLERSTAVYTRLSMAGGRRWSHVAWWPEGRAAPETRTEFELTREAEGLELRAGKAPRALAIDLAPRCRLHVGPAVETAPEPRLRDRALVRMLAGRLSDDRWLSRAREVDGEETGWAVHEVVDRPKAGR